MYTTHGGIHLTSLFCNKEGIQFVITELHAFHIRSQEQCFKRLSQKVLSKMERVNFACQEVF